MSDCCSIERSAETSATALTDKGAVSRCIECGSEGRPVERQTILHHLKHDQLDRVNGESYRFCADPHCEVVYYGEGGTRFIVAELRELVTAKAKGDDRPICYCFGFTEGDARQQIECAGRNTIPTTISRLIKAGMCACEVRNPAGVCCLGEVNRTAKRLSAQRSRLNRHSRLLLIAARKRIARKTISIRRIQILVNRNRKRRK